MLSHYCVDSQQRLEFLGLEGAMRVLHIKIWLRLVPTMVRCNVTLNVEGSELKRALRT